jgi:hypothetical protein
MTQKIQNSHMRHSVSKLEVFQGSGYFLKRLGGNLQFLQDFGLAQALGRTAAADLPGITSRSGKAKLLPKTKLEGIGARRIASTPETFGRIPLSQIHLDRIVLRQNKWGEYRIFGRERLYFSFHLIRSVTGVPTSNHMA